MAAATVFEGMNAPSCGLDVHKDVIEACVLDEQGTKHRKSFSTMRKSLYALRDWIISLKCFHVLMESTSVYWISVYEVLEEVTGMDVGVGNPHKMKQVPGRPKTDKGDADWIARLCMIGLILKSFVVGRKFRELREYTRYHKKLVQERARQVNRIEKLLQMNGFKLSSVLSDITGASGMKLLKKLRDNGIVTLIDVQLSLHKRVRKPAEEIESAINGKMKVTSRLLLGKMLSRLEACDKEIAEIYGMMQEMSQGYRSEIDMIDGIPGMGELSAIYVMAEISDDMSSFRTSGHLTAWAGLAPKDNESAGRLRYSKTQKANIYIKSVMLECAWAVIKTRNTRLSNWYWCNVGRIGKKKAITAVARKLLVYIYAMLKNGEMYDDSLDVADTEKRKAWKLESARKIVAHRANDSDVQTHCENIAQAEEMRPQASTYACEATSGVSSNGPPKKRGRPRKTTVDNVQGIPSTVNAKTALPKKRGRPRKAVGDVVQGQTEPGAVKLDAPKKRGRPRKTTVEVKQIESLMA
jgi:transposase